MAARKKLSPNAQRRARARAAEKLGLQRERLAALEPGGGPDCPIDVPSASVVEVHAQAMPCLRCGASTRVDAHSAETVEARRLRIVRLACPQCGAARMVHYRIVSAALN
jgi:hypothetical protein